VRTERNVSKGGIVAGTAPACQERIEADRIEADRIEADRIEADRIETDRMETDQIEADLLEVDLLEADQMEVNGMEQRRTEADRTEGLARYACARRGAARAAWMRRSRKLAQAGCCVKATQILRAGIATGGMTSATGLRMRFLLLRWELATGQWDEVLRSVEGLYARLARRGILGGPVVGWVYLARAVAHFQLGEGAKYRRSMARVLRAVRRGRGARLREVAICTAAAAVDAPGRLPGARLRILSRLPGRQVVNPPRRADAPGPRPAVSDPSGPAIALAAWLRGETSSRPVYRSFCWSDLPSLLVGPPHFRSVLAPAGQWALLLPRTVGGNDAQVGREDAGGPLVEAWLGGAAARPRRRMPAWVVPVLSRLAEERIPEEGPERRGQLLAALGSLATRTREPWARALALEAVAEGRLWHLAPGDGPAPIRRAAVALVEARADLALAAGMFRKAGWDVRADACERRWARLALPVLGPQVAEPAAAEARPATAEESLNGKPPGQGVSIERGRSGPAAPRLSAFAEPDLGRVQRALAGEGFLSGDRRTLRDLTPLFLLAAAPLPVLILGESGTGKEVLARALHRWSRLRGDLVAIHCGAIPRDLLESELFGHARGAFTGAAGDKPGLVEAADGGTLFLDEIGEMGSEAQMKMLRVLESGEVRRLGELRPRRTALRLVAATHRDLESEVDRGAFRLDLFHRIRGVVVRVRPLRERRGDIPLLAGRFLASAGGGDLRFTPEGLACLVAHAWPGNVRELCTAVQRAVHLARALGQVAIDPAVLGLAPAASAEPAESAQPDPALRPSPLTGQPGVVVGGIAAGEAAGAATCWSARRSYAADEAAGTARPPGNGAIPETVRVEGLDAYLDGIERRIIVRALEDHGWNRTHAARDLGGLSRTTLLGKIKRLGIDGDAPARAGMDVRAE
jgi:DNA-binding NtrC family response regulator